MGEPSVMRDRVMGEPSAVETEHLSRSVSHDSRLYCSSSCGACTLDPSPVPPAAVEGPAFPPPFPVAAAKSKTACITTEAEHQSVICKDLGLIDRVN